MQGNVDQTRDTAVVVIGVSGSGKTTVGQALAPALGAGFIEGDAYHSAENIAKMRSGTPLTDADRGPWLEALGHAIADHDKPVVVACSALKRAYRETLMRAAGSPLTFILLTIEAAVLASRMQGRQHFMPVSLLQSQLATLEPLAPDEDGTHIVETGTVQDTVEAICGWLGSRDDRPIPSLSFRRATRADLPAIIDMLADDERGRTREDPRSPMHPLYLEAFDAIDADSRQLLLVAEQDGETVGSLQLTFIPNISHLGALRGQIEGVRVTRTRRGQGIGREMITWAIDECRRRRCNMVQLTTNASRADAQRFYLSLGFEASHVGLKLAL